MILEPLHNGIWVFILEQKGVGTIPELMQQLRYNVYTKKSKNVEVLHHAAEVCLDHKSLD